MKAAEEDAAAERGTVQEGSRTAGSEEAGIAGQSRQARGPLRRASWPKSTQSSRTLPTSSPRANGPRTNLLAEASKSAESFEVPDGRISWVNQNGTVWINLGAADSLRRQITFSVFDADQQDPAKTDQKGSIEVTRILGDHMAEARITNDDPRNPILTGDQIYSQVWHRGKKLRFALTGIIDLDGDGRSDMKLARDLIELNGGVVDAYLADDGKVEGEITVNTRYLVLGDFPEEANQAALQEGWQEMSDDAKTNGVEVITLDKFLNQIGYAPDDRMVQLGAGARAVDFPPQPDAGPLPSESRGGSTQFRPRTPNIPNHPESY